MRTDYCLMRTLPLNVLNAIAVSVEVDRRLPEGNT